MFADSISIRNVSDFKIEASVITINGESESIIGVKEFYS